jgi:hypothetical protein
VPRSFEKFTLFECKSLRTATFARRCKENNEKVTVNCLLGFQAFPAMLVPKRGKWSVGVAGRNLCVCVCQTPYFQGCMALLFFTFRGTPSQEGTGKNDLKEGFGTILGRKVTLFVKQRMAQCFLI